MLPYGNQKTYIVTNVTISMKTNKIKDVKPDKLEELEASRAYLRIIYWFFDYPTVAVSLSDLAKNSDVSKKLASLVVNLLLEEGFLNKEVIGKTWRITCNQEHSYNVSKKIPYNLGRIYESGIVEAIKAAIPNYKSIILFGSYRKGDDTHESDIDVAVEILGNEEMFIHNFKVSSLGYRENVNVNAHMFSRNKIDLNVFANISNGIVLEGFLEVRP